MSNPDAIVVGSGPNGLAAAVVIAQAGRRVLVVEAEPEIGGCVRSGELTLPGFVHDICSAVYPFAFGSPFLRSLPLADYGVEWIEPPVMVAHPFDDHPAAVILRSLSETMSGLGGDGPAYESLVGSLVKAWPQVESPVLGPPIHLPRHPFVMARFGMKALQSAERLS